MTHYLTRNTLGWPAPYGERRDAERRIFDTVPKPQQRAALAREKAKARLVFAGSLVTVVREDALAGESLCQTPLFDQPHWFSTEALEEAP